MKTVTNVLRTNPVRFYGWIVAGLAFADGITQTVGNSWDPSTGWRGFGLAVVTAVTTELARRRAWSEASVEQAVVQAKRTARKSKKARKRAQKAAAAPSEVGEQ
jgi:hypothetical protein